MFLSVNTAIKTISKIVYSLSRSFLSDSVQKMVLLTGFIVLLDLFSVASSVATTQQSLRSNNNSGWNSPVWFDDGSAGLFTPREYLSV
ncbi:hypothetical protein K435DRAFT_208570 [Dendrothele bispora CBS 962.96]|uniref:Uncharacterized protein n=1 Tax=Dendrothele bispora (strain CBS 962.96) TaxID=1314807 RepID=A0A4S8LTG3_DENBC|nr:hypothetical protein K435DRAFT_208570 [Dendrothele bispora CBS 962.96]